MSPYRQHGSLEGSRLWNGRQQALEQIGEEVVITTLVHIPFALSKLRDSNPQRCEITARRERPQKLL